MTYQEKTDPTPTEVELLTQNIAILTNIVQEHNRILMCLLHKFDVNSDLPHYFTKEAFEKDMIEKVNACNETIRKIYGIDETDKS